MSSRLATAGRRPASDVVPLDWPPSRWLALAAITLAINVVALASAGYAPWWHALGAAVGNLVQLALVATLAAFTARRVRGAGVRCLLRHAATATLAAFVAVFMSFAARHLPHAHVARHPVGPGPGAGFLAWWFVFLYGAVAALTHAARTRAELRDRERDVLLAELRALQAQLDPHFLFNALHSVGALIRADADGAEDAVERLGTLLRYVLRAGRRGARDGDPSVEVTLEEELAFVRDYLALEHIRFGDRLRVVFDVVAETAHALVPALVLQPLVENAVKHAVAARLGGATIWLAVSRTEDPVVGDALRVRVRDDGPGLVDAPRRGRRPHGERVGLDGLRRRLAMCYAERQRLEIAAPPEGGFTVSVVLPWRAPAAGAGDWVRREAVA
jgi:signal transduction histidine kinase